MLWRCFSIYDAGSRVFLRPFYVRADQEAIRAAVEAGTDRDTPIGKYPAEFFLFRLGDFDDSAGRFELLPQPEGLGPVASLMDRARSDASRAAAGSQPEAAAPAAPG